MLRNRSGRPRSAIRSRGLTASEAAAAVVRFAAVEPGAVPVLRLELLEPLLGALAELVERPELDRVGRASLGAGRFVAPLEPVVAESALPDAAVLLPAELQAEDLDRRIAGVPR